MIIQNPPKEPIVHENGRDIHPVWGAFFDNLINILQRNLSDEGIITPGQSTTDITLLTNAAPFTLIGDSTTNELKVNLNGVFKTITTS